VADSKYYLGIIVIFTIVLVGKGWTDYKFETDSLVAYIEREAPSVKAIYFYDRSSITADAYYNIAGSITFYDKWYALSDQLRFAKHEVCHHKIYTTKHNLRHSDPDFQRCVAE
jgi:predicted SprT family Zn-dependent metalloprotease